MSKNAIVETGSGFSDHSSKVFINPSVSKICPIKGGACREGTAITAWDIPEEIDCPAEVPLGKREIVFHVSRPVRQKMSHNPLNSRCARIVNEDNRRD